MLSSTSLALLVATATASLCFLVKRLFKSGARRCTVPSAPTGHWLLGHSGLPIKDWAETMFEWSRVHGPLLQFRLFLLAKPLAVVVNRLDLVKEMLMSREFAGRDVYSPYLLEFNPGGSIGIAPQSWSPTWKELHKFVLSTLSAMGFGRAPMEGVVLAEADALVDAMLETGGAPFDQSELLKSAVFNVIAKVIFGGRIEIGRSSSLRNDLGIIAEGLHYLLKHPVYVLCPALMKVFPTKRLREIRRARASLEAFVDEEVAKREKSTDPNDEPRDFMDAVVLERRKNPGAPHLSDDNLHQTVIDLFMGGTDTTSSALNWIVAWLLHHPDVKRRLVAEIERVVGVDGVPSMTVAKDCHFLQAFVDEALRRSSVADFTLMHRPVVPVFRLAGYDVPDSVCVVPNLLGIHHDPATWPEPRRFDPERFIDADGEYRKSDDLIPFGVGPRRCIGEKLARLELYVFTVRMLQRLEIRLAEGCELPAMKGLKPLTRTPEFYRIIVEGVK